MSSLVLELQAAAMDPDAKVADILRKALVVATKLGISEFRDWCELELQGYEEPNLPPYRRLQGQIKAFNPYNGWIPVVFPNPEVAEQLSSREIGQSIGELERMLDHNDDQNTFQIPFPHDLLMSLFGRTRESGLGMVPTLLINRTQIFRVLEAIRNTVLEWSLKLEQSGILGEGMTFTREEVQKAAMVTYNIQSFTGILGNVSSSQIQVGDYNSIHAELKRLGIPQEERNELEQIVDELPKADKEKKTALLKRGAEWVTRNATALGALSETIRKWFEVGS
jgi:hypothetical protein